MIVVDTSAMVTALVDDGQDGDRFRAALARDDRWAAPMHMPVEVASALRGLVLGGRVTEDRAGRALRGYGQMQFVWLSLVLLLPRIWALRGAMTAYDATFVATAEHLDCALVTSDLRLARVAAGVCSVTVP